MPFCIHLQPELTILSIDFFFFLYTCSPGSGVPSVDAGDDPADGEPLDISLTATDDEWLNEVDEPSVIIQAQENYVWHPDLRQRRYRGTSLDATRYRLPAAFEVPREALCRCDFGHAAAVSMGDPYFAKWFHATHHKNIIGSCTCKCQFCKPKL